MTTRITAHAGQAFDMIFDDGDTITGCLDRHPTGTDADIIWRCNASNPTRWGKVVAIQDKRPCTYYGD